MIRVLLCLALFFVSVFASTAQLNTTLQSSLGYTPDLNDIWGYASGGKEYALVGMRTGVNIRDITDPTNPIHKGTATGPTSTWRDIKTFGDYAYVTNENSGGLLIIDLSNLATASITSSDWSYWEPTIAGLGTITDCHNLYIDGNGYGYLAGCNVNSGGIIYIDLFTNPGSPAYVDKAPSIYAHDVFVQNNIMYTSDIYAGKFTIYNVTDKANTLFVADASTPTTFTHNAWANSTGSILYTTDEKANAYTAAYDISDPNDIVELDRFRPLASVGTGVIPHNVHVAGDFLVISHYSDGVVIVDASVPDNLVEVGNYDTWTSGGTGFNGAWGAYPYLPSQNILVSDPDNGLFVIDPTYVYAARLEGIITDFGTGNPINGATIVMNSAQANTATTNFLGEYKTGIAANGTYNVTISKSGYADVVTSVTISNGVITPLNVAMGAPLPLELLSFDIAKNERADVLLNWEAAQSDDLFEFEIQRAGADQEFRTIATIIEESEAGVSKHFSYTDLNPGNGIHYYRLKLIEIDRSFNFSEVRNISIDKFKEVVFFPNPIERSTQFVSLEGDFNRNTEYLLNVISPLGEKNSFAIRAENMNRISTDRFYPGVNFLEIVEHGNVIFQTSVVNNSSH